MVHRLAFDMICAYAKNLGPHFAPVVPQIEPLMIEHLKFVFEDGVRMAAAASLPYMMDAYIKHPQVKDFM